MNPVLILLAFLIAPIVGLLFIGFGLFYFALAYIVTLFIVINVGASLGDDKEAEEDNITTPKEHSKCQERGEILLTHKKNVVIGDELLHRMLSDRNEHPDKEIELKALAPALGEEFSEVLESGKVSDLSNLEELIEQTESNQGQLISKFENLKTLEAFWAAYLNEVYEDFSQNLRRRQRYCELCRVSFHQGRTPEYHSIIQQQLYLLRYFSAYLIEYFEAFSYIANLHFLPQAAKIASLGCGSGIDGAAAHFAFSQYSYQGIDLEKWSYWCMAQNAIIMNVSEFVPTTQNVFIFPKSLNEFPKGVVEKLAANLPKTNAECICIINSMRDNAYESVKCEKMLQAFGKTVKVTTHELPTEYVSLRNYQKWFHYPSYISSCIKNLSSSCPCSKHACQDCCEHEILRPCSGESEKPMNRHPMTNSYFRTQIHLIQR